MKKIIGISCYFHDSAACFLDNGILSSALQEERFTRIKHDSNFPINSLKKIFKIHNTSLKEIDAVVFYEKPFLKFERLIETYVALAPKGFKSFCRSMPIWLKDKLFQKKMLISELRRHDPNFDTENKVFFSEHHLSHAASAFFPSPFKEAIILTADGVGEWATTTVAIGNNNNLEIKKEIHFPHSLGLLYSAFTYYTGFKVNSGEYKLMGLAPYGLPIYEDLITNNLIDIKEDGSFRLDQTYFNYTTGLTMTSKKFHNLFKKEPRNPLTEDITQFHMDIAASIQKVTEDIIIKLTKSLKEEYKIANLCLAGGVALNCVANGKILRSKIFENIWVQPAAGDAGGSLGAALAYWYTEKNNYRKIDPNDSMNGSYLGPEYSQDQIEEELTKLGAVYSTVSEDELIEITAEDLSNGKVVGWFQGRMEFGPRALGARSILGDPRLPSMQKNLNLKIKFRESFRPFAPSILKDDLSEWFDIKSESPYMLMVAKINSKKIIKMNDEEKKLFGIEKLNIRRSNIPAVTHVDYTARIQTVTQITNKKYFKLLEKFKSKTGYPLLINTSFNIRGEPIVNTPAEAFNCFLGTELDILVIGNCYLKKNEQTNISTKKYSTNFELD